MPKEKPIASPTFWNAIIDVIRGLKNHPPLLFAMGLGIILLAAGSLAFENLRVVTIALLVLAFLGFFVWVLIQALTLHKAQRPSTALKAGDIKIGRGAKLKHNKITGGSINVGNEPLRSGQYQAGDIHIAPNVEADRNELEGGSINLKK
jgi:hypothetical protein